MEKLTSFEQANILVDKFENIVYCYAGSEMLTNTHNNIVALKNQKKCALIVVDEIIDKGNRIISELIDDYFDSEFNNYWSEVKSEIDKL